LWFLDQVREDSASTEITVTFASKGYLTYRYADPDEVASIRNRFEPEPTLGLQELNGLPQPGMKLGNDDRFYAQKA
jgi:hypothetical protein